MINFSSSRDFRCPCGFLEIETGLLSLLFRFRDGDLQLAGTHDITKDSIWRIATNPYEYQYGSHGSGPGLPSCIVSGFEALVGAV